MTNRNISVIECEFKTKVPTIRNSASNKAAKQRGGRTVELILFIELFTKVFHAVTDCITQPSSSSGSSGPKAPSWPGG